MFKNALVSVSNKEGLVNFLKPLCQKGLRVVSTGGTYKYLKENGISVIEISEQTGFPEVMGGRVKTLHPMVHMALLSRDEKKEDHEILNKYGLQPFDLLICNLYPFEESLVSGVKGSDLIEKIDIGGPSMLRSAAKNFNRLTVICDPSDYDWIQRKEHLTIQERQKLSAKVFAHTSAYDSIVAKSLGANWGEEFSVAGRKNIELRYGENPQQSSQWYYSLANQDGLHTATILQGKPLSYNNILDLDAAAALVKQFKEPAVVAVKHNNPCGVACHSNLTSAVELAIKSDPVSVFGGIIAINAKVDKACAEKLLEIFLECIVATDYTVEALEVFSKKKNLRILKWDKMVSSQRTTEIRSVCGGFLVQEPDQNCSDPNNWKFIGEQPDEVVINDLIFSEKVCASLKSNAIAIVKNQQTLGLGMGQVNRVEAVQHAIERMSTHHGLIKNSVLASDAFFPFPDSIVKASAAGVKWIIQPGGSVKDDEVIKKAQELQVNMVITGVRHFRH